MAAKHPAETVLGLKPKSKVYEAAKLYMRESGATNADVVKAVGSPHRNFLKKVADAGHKVEKTKVEVDGKKVTSYRIVVQE